MDRELQSAIAELGKGPYTPGSSATAGFTYNPLPFADCKHVPCHRPNSPERWKVINANTDFKDADVLDLGCATGYFSFMSNKAGAKSVFSIDHDPKAIRVCAAAMSSHAVSGVQFIVGTERDTPSGGFDIGFAMSILNWIGKGRAEQWLKVRSRHIDILWVEIPMKGDGRRGAHWLTTPAKIVEWLKGYSKYKQIAEVGVTRAPHGGQLRPLFRCSR